MYPGHFVRRDVAEEKRRQLIRQTNPELRQLEAKLRLAYVNKERAAQLEERKLDAEARKRDKEVGRNRVVYTLWGVPSVVIFCRSFLTCSTSCWADTAATVQPS